MSFLNKEGGPCKAWWMVLIEDAFENVPADNKFFRTYHTAHSLRIQAHLHCVSDTGSHAAKASVCFVRQLRFLGYCAKIPHYEFIGRKI